VPMKVCHWMSSEAVIRTLNKISGWWLNAISERSNNGLELTYEPVSSLLPGDRR
jgi:hypothetical protein